MADPHHKTCTKCGQTKPIKEFPLCRNKPRARCRPCHIQDAVEWVNKNKEKRAAYYKAWYIPHPIKLLTEAEKIARKKAGAKKWREANADRHKEMRKEWNKKNPHRVLAKLRKYQSSKNRAYPQWANDKAIEEFYLNARSKTEDTGIVHEVDHIVPLTSERVCGLHCEFNLQVLPRHNNRSKANRYWPDMP